MSEIDEKQKINEALYQKNIELTTKNKTLSFLEKLYQTGILNLSPEKMAQIMTDDIREDLNLEFAGIFLHQEEIDSLVPLVFSESERLTQIFNKLDFNFKNIKINNLSKSTLFQQVVIRHTSSITNSLEDVWDGLIKAEFLKKIKEESNIKTILLHPLMSGANIFGVIILGMNRDFNILNAFEKEAIKSFTNVIAFSLDKAYLYKNLQDANEKLKSLDELKTEFLSLVSHQLRSPLTTIIGYSSMLLDDDFGKISNEKQTSVIGRVMESGRHLANIVEDLLDVAKIEQGGMQYFMTPFDFEKMAQSLGMDLDVTTKNKGLKFSFETDNQAPYLVNGDMEKIRQVVLNLTDNAIKYTQEGAIKMKLTKNSIKKKIRIDIVDTGVGISAEVQPTLFKKFARGDGGKIDTTGTGLGLYIAREIIEAHKGIIGVDSLGVGLGSTFFFELDAI